jgi:hypothetical protein
MKRVSIWVALVLAGAATAWFMWAFVTERAVSGWLAEREAEGWSVAVEEIAVRGFPTAFRTQAREVSLADPGTAWAWHAPVFTLQQPALDLGRVTAIWPAEQQFATPTGRLTLRAEDLTATLDVRPFSRFLLERSETRARGLEILASDGAETTLTQANAVVDWRPEDGPATYDIRLEAREWRLPETLLGRLAPDGLLPPAIPAVTAEMRVAFDRPWDLSAIEDSRPQPRRIDLEEWRAEWGDLMFRSSGSLTVDAEGRATGDLAIRAENWETMLDLAERSGALTPALAGTARAALGFVAGLSGAPEHLDATLRLEDGFAYLGPLPLGEAPRLSLR